MTSGRGRPRESIPGLAEAARWLFLAGLLLMVTGDGPSSTVRITKWPTPVPFLAWPWLYIVLFSVSAACASAAGIVRWRPAPVRFLGRPLAFLLAALLASAIFSQVPSLSVQALLAVLAILGFCWLASSLLEDARVASMARPVLGVAILLLAFRVIVWRRDEGLDVVAFQVLNNAWLGKLQLAWVFNLIAPLLLARFLVEKRWTLVVLHALAWAGAGLATYLLFSRMGTIVFTLSTAAIFAMNRGSWPRALVILLLAAVLGSGLAARSVGTFGRVTSTVIAFDRNPGVDLRLHIWRDALRLFRQHPIVGTGIGTFDDVAYSVPGTVADRTYFRQGWHAHNTYLHLLAETGILGLTAWCVLWWSIVARLARGRGPAEGHARAEISAVLCAVLAFLLLSTTEVLIGARVHASLRMNLTVGLVVVLGLCLVSGTGRRSDA